MTRLRRISALLLFVILLWPSVSRASVPSLEIAPLKYEASLTSGKSQTGYITVSNPGDATITVRSLVQGMRQIGTDGRLEFFDDPLIAKGITISSDNVRLAPREAVNFQFLIQPDALPRRGVYAAIFFETVPKASGSGTRVLTSARVGTLLLLQNGGSGTSLGAITNITIPWFTYAESINGEVTYHNTGVQARNPQLALSQGDGDQIADGPYTLPDASRSFRVRLKGNFAGPIYVMIRDRATGAVSSRWVFAITGYWRWAFPLALIALVVLSIALKRRIRRRYLV